MTVTALGATALGPPVNAAVGGNRVINVSPSDSIVLIEGLSDTTEYTVTLERGGVTIGTATGTPADFGIAGALELNHAAAPTFCWSGVTPEIIPGDVVRLTGGGVNDFATVEGLTVGDPVPVGNTSFTVSGTLDIDRTATPLDPNNLSVFVRLDVGGVDWRAESSTVDPANPLVFNGEAFTATFNSGRFGGVNGSPVNASVIDAAASPRVLEASYGVGTVPVEGVPNELTTVGPDAGDPLPEECPARESRSMAAATPSVINVANAGSALTVSGATAAGSTVNVTLRATDGATVSKPAVVSGTTWSASFAAGELTALNGVITVTSVHSPTNGGEPANTRTILRDVVAPIAPASFPDGGTFQNSTSITLSAGPGETIRYTLGNGSQPSPTATSGTIYTGAIPLSQTAVLKVVAVDAAGNVSPVLTRTFTRATAPGTGTGTGTNIIPLAPQLREAKSGKPGGVKTAKARWRASVANGAVRDGYEVRALKLRPGKSAKVRQPVAVGPNATKLSLRLPAGKYRFQVRATSAAGDSAWSARSNKVRAR